MNKILTTPDGFFSVNEIETPKGTFCLVRALLRKEQLIGFPIAAFRGPYDPEQEDRIVSFAVSGYRIFEAMLNAGIVVEGISFKDPDLVNGRVLYHLRLGGQRQLLMATATGSFHPFAITLFYALMMREKIYSHKPNIVEPDVEQFDESENDNKNGSVS